MAPQSSTPGFKVCLPGNFELDASDADGIIAVHANNAGDDSFIVEFKYEQDATRYLKLARKAWKAASKPAASTSKSDVPPALGPYSGLWGMPAVPDTTSAKPGIYEVEVSGLPKHLMSPMMMEATLEQAGLEKDVLNISLSKSGKTQINLSSRHAADACLEHFHGRNWNPTGGAVSAKIVSAPQPKKEKIKPVISSSLSKYAPAYIHSSLLKETFNTSQALLGTSDASTTVSDEDAGDEESWEADLKKVMSGCAYE